MKERSSMAAVVDVAESRPANRKEIRPRRQPRYHVILWDDEDHSYDYVIRMMQELFAYGTQRGYEIARAVDKTKFSVAPKQVVAGRN